MNTELPLDDLLGKTYYIDGAPWRVIYNREIQRVALRRVAPEIAFDVALERIASGALLWNPPERFEPLGSDDAFEAVQRHLALLDAFRQSPTFLHSNDWELQSRLSERQRECRAWLARRALTSGDGSGEKGSETA